MKSPLKILWFTLGGAGNATSRHRAYIYETCLRNLSARVDYVAPFRYQPLRERLRNFFGRFLPGKTAARMFSGLVAELVKDAADAWLFFYRLRRIFSADRIIYQRTFPGTAEKGLALLMKKEIFFDCDDAIHLVPPSKSQDPAPAEGLPNPEMERKMTALFRRCKGVIVSTSNLQQWAGRSHPRVHLLPTSVTVEERHLAPTGGGHPPVLGWIGAPENQRYLLGIFPAVAWVLDRIPESRLNLVTSGHWDLPHAKVTRVPWSLVSYRDEIRRFRVGLAPLDDTPWTRAKMQFRAVQCAAQGVPVVASAVGFDRSLWRDGENVLFASTLAEWKEKILSLLEDASLRDRIGRAGLDTVRREYAAEVNAERLIRILDGSSAPSRD